MSNIPKGILGWNPKENQLVPKITTRDSKVNVEYAKFDDLILNQGVRIKVYRSALCPNVRSIDGAEHDIECQLCFGAQYVDLHPLQSWAYIHDQTLEKNVAAEGSHEGNSISATFLQSVELQYFTLVELCDFTEIFYERIKRQDGKVDILRYPGIRVNFIFDQDGVEYIEGSDFSLNANRNIQWKANKGPISGVIYTIHYETQVRFRAVRASHSNRFTQITRGKQALMVKMNEAWQLEKDYLVERKDLDGNLMESNQINDPT